MHPSVHLVTVTTPRQVRTRPCMHHVCADVAVGPTKTWHALLHAAIAALIVITVAAEPVTSRAIQKDSGQVSDQEINDDDLQAK
jgi:hypothetical protein